MNMEALLWKAIKAKVGIEVFANNVDAFKRQFYTTRKILRDKGLDEFDNLQCKIVPKKNTVYLINKGEVDGKEERETTGEGDSPFTSG